MPRCHVPSVPGGTLLSRLLLLGKQGNVKGFCCSFGYVACVAGVGVAWITWGGLWEGARGGGSGNLEAGAYLFCFELQGRGNRGRHSIQGPRFTWWRDERLEICM
jgi:hypothetical protein